MISFLCIVFVHIFESGLRIHMDFVPPVGHGVRAKYGEADDRFDAKLISSAGSVRQGLATLIGGFPIPGFIQKMASERSASGYQTFFLYADVGLITHPNALLFLLYR